MIARYAYRSLRRLQDVCSSPALLPSRPAQPASRSFSNVVKRRRPFRMAIIGSGPAGFYTAYRVMTRIQDAVVDMYEQLPVPFGLVRFGVAPDHPEVKNCQDKFDEIARSPRFNFIGNVEIGKTLPLVELRPHYDAVLFAYGASKDKELGIPGEDLEGVYSARAFVGWYNGLPEYAHLRPKLDAGDTAVIVGQGNVALDVARTLLGGLDRLRGTDMTEAALETLSHSTIRRVHVVGRRGPMQASFTIKEVRELMLLPDVSFQPIQAELLPGQDVKLSRAPKRLADLLRKHSEAEPHMPGDRQWSLDFLKSPKKLQGSGHVSSVMLGENEYMPDQNHFDGSAKVKATGRETKLDTSLVFRSIGYKSEPLPGMDDLDIIFNATSGVISNEGGRVQTADGYANGLYCAGWVKNGPTGVIASTMEDAFATAEAIAEDWASTSSQVHGWEALRGQISGEVDWTGWSRINAAEREIGLSLEKVREKITKVDEMLEIAAEPRDDEMVIDKDEKKPPKTVTYNWFEQQ